MKKRLGGEFFQKIMRKKISLWINIFIVVIHRLFMKLVQYWSNVVESKFDFGPNIKIGRNTYGVSSKTILLAPSSSPPKVTIGNFCSFAKGVVILANADHPTNLPSTFPFRTNLYPRLSNKKRQKKYQNLDVVSHGSIEIGHDVWIGENAIILSGVHIGTGAVIGAGAVVARNVPPYSIAVGIPAKVVRLRFSDDLIARLLKSEWWNLSDETLQKLDPFLYSDDIAEFLTQVESRN